MSILVSLISNLIYSLLTVKAQQRKRQKVHSRKEDNINSVYCRYLYAVILNFIRYLCSVMSLFSCTTFCFTSIAVFVKG